MTSTPSTRRNPRRERTAVYTLRVELQDLEPAIWRRLTVPSDLMLDDLHSVLQTVMGWTDSHLHGFVRGELYSPDAERFEMRPITEDDWDWLQEGDGLPGFTLPGIEDEVRLDELLATVGDEILYHYDYGDSWQHSVVLESVDEAPLSVARMRSAGPVCLDGARACPPEDCGGTHGYEELQRVLAMPGHPEYEELLAWTLGMLGGEELHAGVFNAEAFDPAAVTAELAREAALRALVPAGTPLAALLKRLSPEDQPELFGWLAQAGLAAEPAMAAEEFDRATRHLRWLLRVIGPDGIALTPAGYLRPSVVEQGMAELGWEERSVTKGYRESDHFQLGLLREAAQKMGLTRKAKGMLLRTKAGHAGAEDPAALLRRIAARLPLEKERFEREAALLWLLGVAAGQREAGRGPVLADAIAELGWRFQGKPAPLADRTADWLPGHTKRYFQITGAFGAELPSLRDEAAESWGRELARMVLRG